MQQRASSALTLGEAQRPVNVVPKHLAVVKAGQPIKGSQTIKISFRCQRITQAQHQLAGVHRFGKKIRGAQFECA